MENNKEHLVHIGLGKTGTTTLQNSVFPLVNTLRPDWIYNDPTLIQHLRKIRIGSPSTEIKTIKSLLAGPGRGHFISMESLVNWNPRLWEDSADMNLEIFGRNAKIIITVRETIPWLTSVYQQKIHEGNIIRPQDFFLTSGEYDKISSYIPLARLTRLDVDSFDLLKLKNIYEKRFDSVSFVPLKKIGNLTFLSEFFGLKEYEFRKLKKEFAGASHKNRAYSKIAMRLTFAREGFFSILGATTYGSHFHIPTREFPSKLYGDKSPSSGLGFYQKIIQVPIIICRRLGWRGFLQNYLDKILPYQKYQLPPDVYINHVLQRSNDDFVDSL